VSKPAAAGWERRFEQVRAAGRRPGAPSNARPRPPPPPADPLQRQAALSTIERGNLTMDGPVHVLQGYDALIFRIPIFVPTPNPEETWG
jgi:hypothetical protein